MRISFFKTSKPKQFGYRPLYYDERKEELEQIKQSAKTEQSDATVQRMKVKLHRSWHQRQSRHRSTRSSSVRLLIYLLLLFLIVYFMFFAKIF